jgi:corrinoid protein of di/trimethylamine methyltransferase
MEQIDIIKGLEQAVLDCDTDGARQWAAKALEEKVDLMQAMNLGLIKGIKAMGDAFGKGEAFLPDLILSSEAMKAASDMFEEALRQSGAVWKSAGGTLVIGTVKGDIHDIGKTLVATLFKAAGYTVIDLGVDVPKEKFVEAVASHKPDILGISSLLTTGAGEQKAVIDALQEQGLRDRVAIMVGGGAVTQAWADQIGADAYAGDAREAVESGNALMAARTERRH